VVQLRARLNRRRSHELEEERGLADDDLAARLFGEADLVGGTDPLGLPLEGGEVADARGESDAPGHPVEEVQVVVAADQLEQLELRGEVRLHDEHRLLAGAHGDIGALLDDALLEDAPGSKEADPEDLRSRRRLHGAHDRGHLSGTPGRRLPSCSHALIHGSCALPEVAGWPPSAFRRRYGSQSSQCLNEPSLRYTTARLEGEKKPAFQAQTRSTSR
jgi:hypothetical protein